MFKYSFLIIILIFSFSYPAAALQANVILNDTTIGSGIGLGSLLAVLASWHRNHSILWAIFHAFLGWLYVIYYVLTK